MEFVVVAVVVVVVSLWSLSPLLASIWVSQPLYSTNMWCFVCVWGGGGGGGGVHKHFHQVLEVVISLFFSIGLSLPLCSTNMIYTFQNIIQLLGECISETVQIMLCFVLLCMFYFVWCVCVGGGVDYIDNTWSYRLSNKNCKLECEFELIYFAYIWDERIQLVLYMCVAGRVPILNQCSHLVRVTLYIRLDIMVQTFFQWICGSNVACFAT